MLVNTGSLRIGANVSDEAGGHAHAGAHRLGTAGVAAGMFGDFTAAHDFHSALTTAKDQHRDSLQQHHEDLTGIAVNVRTAVTRFTAMDDHSAQRLRDVIAGPSA